jgi:hypothetical protein
MQGESGPSRHVAPHALMATQAGQQSQQQLDDPPLFRARIASPIAPMHEEPRVASQQVSQQIGGHDVDAMDREGDWIRARGADGYEGWIHTGFLERPTGGDDARRLISLGCVVQWGGETRRTLP